MILDLSLYEPYFYYKNTNNNAKHKNRNNTNHKKNMVYDKLCFLFYHKLNEKDCYYKYNERNEKIKILELLEPLKIKNKMQMIHNLNDESLNLMTLNFICFILNIHLIWYSDHCFYKMNKSETNHINETLFLYNNNEFTNVPDLSDKYEILDINKPLKSISFYKLNDLKDLILQLKLNCSMSKKKDLYDTIYDYYKTIKLI